MRACWLAAAVLALATALSGCGSDGEEPVQAAAADPVEVVLVPPDESAADEVAVTGASPAEAAAVRDALTRLGARSPITSVEFADRQEGRSMTVDARGERHGVDEFEAEWLAELFVEDVALALPDGEPPIVWTELRARGAVRRGGAFAPEGGTPRTAEELRALGATVVERAEADGLQLGAVTVVPIWVGAVKVAVQLEAREFLEGANADWLTSLVPDRFDAEKPYSALVAILAPDGTAVSYGANFGGWAGAWAYEPPAKAGSAAELLPDGPTRLAIQVDQVMPDATLNFVVDCEGHSAGIADPKAVCAEIERDWITLLPPQPTDTTCGGGPVGVSSVVLDGTVGGVALSRSYSGCELGTVNRWEELLGAARE